jgi:lipoate-protein ligase A
MNLLLNTPALNVHEHMALDETLVKLRPDEVTLRFFNWTPGPAVTYGYAQFYSEVCRALPQVFSGEFTRRPTGGGVVFHTDDLTFSLVFQYPGRPAEIYEKLHACISAELARTNAQKFSLSGVAPLSSYRPSHAHEASACFQNPVENDVLTADGAKVLGGALRRFGTTVLYQGSLQLKDARKNPVYKQAVINGVRQFLAVDFTPRGISAQTLQTARALAQTCYSTQSWKEKF